MASELYSSDALAELRRILLSPEALTDVLRPLLIELLREHSAQLAREVMEELAPALRASIREILQDELRDLSPEVAGELASALEPQVTELVRQQLAAKPGIGGLLQPKAQATPDHVAVAQDTPQAQPSSPAESASGKKVASERKTTAPRGCRRLLVLGLAFLVTIVSTSWGWNRADALGGLLSTRGAHPGAAMAAGDNGWQQPPWTPTSSHSVTLESKGATRAQEATSTPQALSTSTATPPPPVTQTPSPVQPSPTPPPNQAQRPASSLASTPTATRSVPLVATKDPNASPTQEFVVDRKPSVNMPASDETPEPADKVFYLTFDDGPNGVWTPQILAILAQYDARASFFVIGREAAKRPELIQEIVDAGHVVAHHTWSHGTLEGIDQAAFAEEIENTTRALEGIVSPYLRTPGGVTNADICAYANELGLEIVPWDIDPSDWKQPPAEEIAARVIRRAGPGKIVIMHDGGGDRSQTVAALPMILEALREQGYVFESICHR